MVHVQFSATIRETMYLLTTVHGGVVDDDNDDDVGDVEHIMFIQIGE